jgi:hypothetical protein
MQVEPRIFLQVVTFGLPAVICYIFVERSARFGMGLAAILMAGGICELTDATVLYQTRSFFGVLKVRLELDSPYVSLIHGTTLHGQQYRWWESDDYAEMRDFPLTYYAPNGPVGSLFHAYNPNLTALGFGAGPMATFIPLPGVRPNLGVIGLGTGTMACYGEPGQHLTFFDIDPAVRDISFTTDKYFTYVQDARDHGVVIHDLVLGDARLTLQRQHLPDSEKYGILMVDAFSSDAIPIHLINRNALQIFLSKTTDNGIIAYHISNRWLYLLPVLANIAEAEGMVGLYIQDSKDTVGLKTATTWVLLARKPQDLERIPNEVSWNKQVGVQDWEAMQPALRAAGVAAAEVSPRWKDLRGKRDPKVGVWTDDYSNLLSVFRW